MPRTEQSDRIVGGQHGALDRLSHDPGVASPRGPGPEAVAPQRPTDGIVDGHETVGELVECLGEEVDVAGPEPAPRRGVAMAAFVVEVPAGQ